MRSSINRAVSSVLIIFAICVLSSDVLPHEAATDSEKTVYDPGHQALLLWMIKERDRTEDAALRFSQDYWFSRRPYRPDRYSWIKPGQSRDCRKDYQREPSPFMFPCFSSWIFIPRFFCYPMEYLPYYYLDYLSRYQMMRACYPFIFSPFDSMVFWMEETN